MNSYLELEEKLNISFTHKEILKTALTHSSYANEVGGECNERLEFLGDAVLELAMSRFLINSDVFLDEGDMTKKRAQAVREEALVIYASHLDLGSYIMLGNGEEQNGGRERPAIIADAFEAVLGAIFQEFGFEKSYQVFEQIIIPYIKEVLDIKDYKSNFQELVQADKRSLTYRQVSETGPSHNKRFVFEVLMDGIIMGTGSGKTKKDAEQEAAKEALKKMCK